MSPLLNYTTKVPARQSAGEVLAMLSAAGAERITLINDRGSREPIGVEFVIHTQAGPFTFRLPVRIDAVLELLGPAYKQMKRGAPTRDQAAAVGWRIVKDWVEAQLALIQTGMVKLEEVMLPYMLVTGHDGQARTAFEAFEQRHLALPAAKADQ